MFEYGFKKAKELAKYDVDDPEEIVMFLFIQFGYTIIIR